MLSILSEFCGLESGRNPALILNVDSLARRRRMSVIELGNDFDSDDRK